MHFFSYKNLPLVYTFTTRVPKPLLYLYEISFNLLIVGFLLLPYLATPTFLIGLGVYIGVYLAFTVSYEIGYIINDTQTNDPFKKEYADSSIYSEKTLQLMFRYILSGVIIVFYTFLDVQLWLAYVGIVVGLLILYWLHNTAKLLPVKAITMTLLRCIRHPVMIAFSYFVMIPLVDPNFLWKTHTTEIFAWISVFFMKTYLENSTHYYGRKLKIELNMQQRLSMNLIACIELILYSAFLCIFIHPVLGLGLIGYFSINLISLLKKTIFA